MVTREQLSENRVFGRTRPEYKESAKIALSEGLITDFSDGLGGGQQCGVTSFKFDSMLPEMGLRLVVQRTPITDECPDAEPEGLFGTEYVYRCLISNDWDRTESDIITYYNRRGASERNFDCQNNDFGWAHMPFSFLKENTVFLIATAILKNFYLHLLDVIG